jgi:hypothetical protein
MLITLNCVPVAVEQTTIYTKRNYMLRASEEVKAQPWRWGAEFLFCVKFHTLVKFLKCYVGNSLILWKLPKFEKKLFNSLLNCQISMHGSSRYPKVDKDFFPLIFLIAKFG